MDFPQSVRNFSFVGLSARGIRVGSPVGDHAGSRDPTVLLCISEPRVSRNFTLASRQKKRLVTSRKKRHCQNALGYSNHEQVGRDVGNSYADYSKYGRSKRLSSDTRDRFAPAPWKCITRQPTTTQPIAGKCLLAVSVSSGPESCHLAPSTDLAYHSNVAVWLSVRQRSD